jgi:hypothetical protein
MVKKIRCNGAHKQTHTWEYGVCLTNCYAWNTIVQGLIAGASVKKPRSRAGGNVYAGGAFFWGVEGRARTHTHTHTSTHTHTHTNTHTQTHKHTHKAHKNVLVWQC